MVTINLLPEDARPGSASRRTGLPGWVVPAGMASIVALAATSMTLRQIQEMRSLAEETAELTKEKEKYKEQVALIHEVESRRDDLSRRVQAAGDLDRGRGTYVGELVALNNALPGNLWITSFTEEAGGQLRIEGRSLTPASVFMFMGGLEDSNPFSGVSLEYMKKDPDQEMGSTAFVLTSRTL